ncbi:MAG: sigma-70 family RNA polymerase sigma factor [Planctomycetes bacterium]|nr:sigma-70 family RNA polymerase sigma factor [Planctomycetota bacterium]
MVLAAQDKQAPQSREALETLCAKYWYPLYAFVRRQGYSADAAGDLTQGFFAQCLEKDWLSAVDQRKGRFRSFLLVAMKHFLSKERAKQRAQKRGGDRRALRLDVQDAETRYTLEPQDDRTPEQYFERQWAVTLLETVLVGLERRYRKEGKSEPFTILKPCLLGQSDRLPYADLSAQLGCTEGAARVMVHRLKKQYRELLREHIAHTVNSLEDIDAEMQHLRDVLSG